jgi:hypothetical protein
MDAFDEPFHQLSLNHASPAKSESREMLSANSDDLVSAFSVTHLSIRKTPVAGRRAAELCLRHLSALAFRLQ